MSCGERPRPRESPGPNAPSSFAPQHLSALSCRSAHVCEYPALTRETPPPRSTVGSALPTLPGSSPWFSAASPRPSWPNSLLPQHFSVASSSTAQVWWRPALTYTARRDGPRSMASSVAHMGQHRAARPRVTLAELTLPVVTPALQRTIVKQRANMRMAAGQPQRATARAQLHGRQRVTHLPGLSAHHLRSQHADAENAVIVRAPTLDLPAFQASARTRSRRHNLQRAGVAGVPCPKSTGCSAAPMVLGKSPWLSREPVPRNQALPQQTVRPSRRSAQS
jgi:hypothetical protein